MIVYGPPSLAKDHPVIKFLAEQQRCTSVSYFKQGWVLGAPSAAAYLAEMQHYCMQYQFMTVY